MGLAKIFLPVALQIFTAIIIQFSALCTYTYKPVTANIVDCCRSFLSVIDAFEDQLGPIPPTKLIMATDNRLRKQIQEMHIKYQKVWPTINIIIIKIIC